MCRGMRKPRKFKVRRYTACLIHTNEYLADFLEAKTSVNLFEMELNEILFNSMTNIWSRHESVQGSDCESIT